MNKIIDIKTMEEYKIWVLFHDGYTKVIDLRNLIGKGISKELLDINYFKLVKIDNGGGIEWPNGFDFCPNYLRDFVQEEILT